jgi:hypothetical protein
MRRTTAVAVACLGAFGCMPYVHEVRGQVRDPAAVRVTGTRPSGFDASVGSDGSIVAARTTVLRGDGVLGSPTSTEVDGASGQTVALRVDVSRGRRRASGTVYLSTPRENVLYLDKRDRPDKTTAFFEMLGGGMLIGTGAYIMDTARSASSHTGSVPGGSSGGALVLTGGVVLAIVGLVLMASPVENEHVYIP